MSLNKRPYKGCRDFLPADMRVRDYLFSHMRKTAETFAYEAYDGPLLEEVALYKAKSGQELINDQIYSFTDRGERFVAIRPEMTPTVARMVAGVHRTETKPLRWYSIPNLMRYEKPQRGRVREHWQFNIDIFGAPENLGEVEVIQLITQFMTSLGASSSMFVILLNDRRFVDTVFDKILNVSESEKYALYKILDKAKKVSAEKLQTMIGDVLNNKNQIKAFNEYLALDSFAKVEEFCQSKDLKESTASFLGFLAYIKNLNLKEFVQYDPTIVRGLDYYTGIVFEIFDKHPDNNRAIAGGGAYANLLKIFNEEPLAGVGFGLGDVTLRDFLETHNLLPDLSKAKNNIFIGYFDQESENICMTIAMKLREAGLHTELNLGRVKFKKLFKLAQSKGHKFVAMMGEDERAAGVIQIKNSESREAKNIKIDNIEEMISFLSS